MTAIAHSLSVSAIWRPSGDQSGNAATPSTWVTWRSCFPFDSMVKICGPSSPTSAWKAIWPLRAGNVAPTPGANTRVARIVGAAIARIETRRRVRIMRVLLVVQGS